jgi:hypothetical protein
MKSLFSVILCVISFSSIGQYNYLKYNDYNRSATAVNGDTWRYNNHFYVKLNGVDYQLDQQSGSLSGTGSSDRVPYWTGTSTLSFGPYWDNTNTRFGIGATPSEQLHITRNQNATTRVQITNTDVTNGSSRSEFRATSGTAIGSMTSIGMTTPGVFIGSGSNHSLFLTTNGSTRATYDVSGNMGIGVTPSYRLHVAHNQNATTTIAVTNSDVTNASSTARLYAESGTAQAVVQAIGTSSPGIFIGSASNHNLNLMANGGTRLSITPSGILNIATAPTNDNTETSILVRQSDGEVQTRSASSLTVSDGDKGHITVGSSGTVWTLDSDVLDSEEYTPTVFNTTNVDGTSVFSNRYQRVFNHVTVYGQIQVDATTAGTTVTFELEIPIVSNLGSIHHLVGMVVCEELTQKPAGTIIAHVANDRAFFNYIPGTTSATLINYSFNYQVIP